LTVSAAAGRAVRIDIVVNNHNYGRFLGDAIDSALAQTHPHVRVIVVDDGSTDDSTEVIASYGDRIVAVCKANGGQASAVNAGFARVEGDIVMFLDSDDTLHPEIGAQVAAAAAANPDAAKIQWRLELAGPDGEPSGIVLPARHIPMPAGDMRRAELTFPFDIAWSSTSGIAIPRAVVARILPMPEPQFRIGADFYLQHLTALLGMVVSLDVVGAYRRLHGGNAFEQAASADLDLGHIHEAIRMSGVTCVQLELLAQQLGLPIPSGKVLSVSDLGHRLVSLRLDPGRHPVAGDTRLGLAVSGARAARRRFDVNPLLRVGFVTWFGATALAPRALALRLGRWMLFPEQRLGANQLLRRLHRGYDRVAA
jgi:CTP:molybdopterin cytidylyltransferase MocA